MSALAKPFQWFYHEFGIVSIHTTGINAYLIILARTVRMFAYGTNALILGEFLLRVLSYAVLHFSFLLRGSDGRDTSSSGVVFLVKE